MKAFLRLFQAERIKLRKSWPMLTAILAPLIQVLFLGVLFWYSDQRIQRFRPAFRFWLEVNFAAWNVVVMPLAAALACERSWGQEREGRSWGLLLAQPVPRAAHYLVKVLGHLALLWLGEALLLLALPLLGWVLRTNPALQMGPLPWGLFLRLGAYSALAAVALAALHTWFSMGVASLGAALGVAAVGSWAGVRLAGSASLAAFLPWSMAARMAFVFERTRPLPWGSAAGSLVTAGILVALGVLAFNRRADADRG